MGTERSENEHFYAVRPFLDWKAPHADPEQITGSELFLSALDHPVRRRIALVSILVKICDFSLHNDPIVPRVDGP